MADNCSSAAYVIGDWHDGTTDVSDLNIRLRINGESDQTGTSKAILGHPLNALVALTELVEKYNVTVKAGQVVLAGAATSAVYLNAGDQIEGITDVFRNC